MEILGQQYNIASTLSGYWIYSDDPNNQTALIKVDDDLVVVYPLIQENNYVKAVQVEENLEQELIQLKNHKQEIKRKITLKKAEKDLAEKGWTVLKEDLNIPGTKKLELTYQISLISYDKRDFSDIEISSPWGELESNMTGTKEFVNQNANDPEVQWVYLFEFNYNPTKKDKYTLKDDDEIDYQDWDDPAKIKGYMKFYLYWYPQPIPTEEVWIVHSDRVIKGRVINNHFISEENEDLGPWDGSFWVSV